MVTPAVLGRWAVVLAASLLALSPQAALAAELRTDEAVTVAENEVIDDDLYAFGNTVTILGTVNGDVIAGGQSVTIAGKVGGSVFAAGSAVSITGIVRGSVRAAGGTVTVAGMAGRDLMLAGGTVTVTDSSRAQFDVYAAGGVLDLGGEIGRDAMLAGGDIAVRGTVGRDLQADGENLRLGDAARIGGNLSFDGPQPPVIPSTAIVRGQTLHTTITAERRRAEDQPPGPADAVVDWVRGFIGMSIFTLICVFGLADVTRRASHQIETAWLGSLGIGAAVFGGTPFLALFALILGIVIGGWWLGPLMLLLLVPLSLAGYAISAYTTGRWLAVKAGRAELARGWTALAGVAVLTLLGALPGLGLLVGMLAILMGLGAFLVALVRADSGDASLQPRLMP